jgi:flagellar protein FlaG
LRCVYGDIQAINEEVEKMNINSVDISGVVKEASAKAAAPKSAAVSSPPAQSSQSAKTSDGNAEVTPAQVKQIVAEMQSQADSMNISLRYSLYGEHDTKIAVKVVNKETGEVIREIPPKEIQSLQTKMGELVGRIFNEKA